MGLFSGKKNTTQKFNAIRTNQSILGAVVPILLGQNRLSGRLIDYDDFTANKAKQPGGKGLGKGGSQYVYSATVVVLLAQGQINYLLNVYDSNGKFVLFSSTESYTIPGGGGTYIVANASIYGNDQGAAVQAPYSVTVTDYGSPGSATYAGTQNVPMRAVASSPGAGQYVVNPATGAYTFSGADAGKTVIVGYSFYRYLIVTQEVTIVPFSGPFTITVNNSTQYKSDQGVAYYPSGTALVQVGGSPAVGQYSHSGATYTFNAADAGNPVIINYEYQDPNIDNNAPNKLSMTLFGGALGQAPWSYMTGKHPSKALGYSQIAYIASQGLYLGYTPELPQYSFELAGAFQVGGGIVDVNPADAIIALLSDPGFGIGFPAEYIGNLTLARQCWAANNFFISPALENQQACASVIGAWLEAGMVGAFWSEGLLKFMPYGDTTAVGNGVTYSPPTNPVANLTDSNFIGGDGEDPVKVARSPWQDAYNRVQVGFSARVNDYNPEICYEQDEAAITRFGLRIEDPVQWDFITTLAAAQYAASMRVQRSVYIRNTYSFTLPSSFAYLEPMDIVTLTDTALGLNLAPVRIQKIEDDPVKGLDITAEDFIWGTAQPAYNPKSVNSPFAPDAGHQDPGDTNAIIFEATNRLGLQTGNILYGFVNGANPNWGGCNVWVSFDGTNYEQYAHVTQPGRLGTLANTLPSYGGANPDVTNTLTVFMNQPGQALASTTPAGAAANVSLCAIVNPANVLELLSYQTATLNGPNEYALTSLYRGVYGTAAITHFSGELFARLDQSSFQFKYDPTYYGKTIHFKFTSFNLLGMNEQALSAVTAYSFVLAGVGKGMIDLNTGSVLATTGSAVVSYSGSFSYTSTTTTITWTWTALTIYRADGTTTVIPNSSIVVSGLTLSTTYYFYPYWDEIGKTLAWVAGGVGTSSSGAIAQTAKTNTLAQAQALANNCPLSAVAMVGATTASGSGGGTGGGSGSCLHGSMKVETRRGIIRIDEVKVFDELLGPEGWTKIIRRVDFPQETFIRIETEDAGSIVCAPSHILRVIDDESRQQDLQVKDLTCAHSLFGPQGIAIIKSIEVVKLPGSKKISLACEPFHYYFAGEDAPTIQAHNFLPT